MLIGKQPVVCADDGTWPWIPREKMAIGQWTIDSVFSGGFAVGCKVTSTPEGSGTNPHVHTQTDRQLLAEALFASRGARLVEASLALKRVRLGMFENNSSEGYVKDQHAKSNITVPRWGSPTLPQIILYCVSSEWMILCERYTNVSEYGSTPKEYFEDAVLSSHICSRSVRKDWY